MLVYVILSLLTILFLRAFRKPKNFPPGPPKLPIIGSLPFIIGSGNTRMFNGMNQLVTKYGKVAGFFLHGAPVVIISDYDILKEVLKREETAGRPGLYPYNENRPGHDFPGLNGKSLGLIGSQGEIWKNHRRLVARNLREFGFGKTSMEGVIQDEVVKLMELLQRKAGQAMSLDGVLNSSVFNSLWFMIVGEKLELEDPKLAKIIGAASKTIRVGIPLPALAIMMPFPSWLKLPILRDWCSLSAQKEVFKAMGDLIGTHIDDHLIALDEGAPRDLLDVLLLQAKKTTDPASTFYKKSAVDSITNIILDLFVAGFETTTSSLVWIFLYMLHYPDLQERVFQEIFKIVGSKRLPGLADQEHMPFTNAVIQESYRFTSFAPFAVRHQTTKEVQIQEFVLPAKCNIMPNLFYIMNDPDYWKNPEKFNPDRFIDSAGRFIKDERVIPFSVGKRQCVGQPLAEKEVFLFFTGIIQNFRMFSVPGKSLPSLDITKSDTGALRIPPQFEIILEKRN